MGLIGLLVGFWIGLGGVSMGGKVRAMCVEWFVAED